MALHRTVQARSAGALVAAVAYLLMVGCTSVSGRPANAVSKPAHTDYVVKQDVTYTPAGWPQPLASDVYLPAGTGPFPAVVVVHGGGWNGRARDDMTSISRALAKRGYIAINIDYRLAPAFHHPAPVEDVRASMEYLRRNAGALHVDPRRIGGWGYSAGAQLVALAARADGEGARPRMRAVVAGGMPADFRRYPESPVIADYIGKPYAEAKREWEAASPFLHVSRGDPPMFLYQGNQDRIVQPQELVAMQETLRAHDVPVESLQVPLLGHIATFLFSRSSRRAALDFFDRYLRGT